MRGAEPAGELVAVGLAGEHGVDVLGQDAAQLLQVPVPHGGVVVVDDVVVPVRPHVDVGVHLAQPGLADGAGDRLVVAGTEDDDDLLAPLLRGADQGAVPGVQGQELAPHQAAAEAGHAAAATGVAASGAGSARRHCTRPETHSARKPA